MYTLTLTREERKTFDWVGHRYTNGNEMASLLSSCLFKPESGDDYWHGISTVTFQVPEHIAWEIRSLSETENNLWPSFGPELKAKMQAFVEGIV